MRVWTWSHSGPDEPPDFVVGSTVYDDDDLCWEKAKDDHWWVKGEPWVVPEDLFGFPLPWSTLIETRGPLRSKPRQDAPSPINGARVVE